jgi:putative transposase
VHGELARLGHTIAASTVRQILHDAGIDPAPRRSGPTLRRVLTARAHGSLALDFDHVDTVLPKRIYALIPIEHGARRVHLPGVSANPDGAWTTQGARNPAMDLGERAGRFKFTTRDRGGQFTGDFDAVLADARIRVTKSPPRAPRANAVCEKMIGTLRPELPDRTLIQGETHLHLILNEHLMHYNSALPHRTLRQLSPHQAETRQDELAPDRPGQSVACRRPGLGRALEAHVSRGEIPHARPSDRRPARERGPAARHPHRRLAHAQNRPALQ